MSDVESDVKVVGWSLPPGKVMNAHGVVSKVDEEPLALFRKEYGPDREFYGFVFTSWRARESYRLMMGNILTVPWIKEPWFKFTTFCPHPHGPNNSLIAWFDNDTKGNRDIVTTGKVGAFLKRQYNLDNEEIKRWTSEWDNLYGELILSLAVTPEDCVHIVRNGPYSCMSRDADSYGGVHPYMIYGGDADMTVAYITRGQKIIARTLVSKKTKKWVQIYGDSSRLTPILTKAGYSAVRSPTDLDGSKVNIVHQKNGKIGSVIFPYQDLTNDLFVGTDGFYYGRHPSRKELNFNSSSEMFSVSYIPVTCQKCGTIEIKRTSEITGCLNIATNKPHDDLTCPHCQIDIPTEGHVRFCDHLRANYYDPDPSNWLSFPRGDEVKWVNRRSFTNYPIYLDNLSMWGDISNAVPMYNRISNRRVIVGKNQFNIERYIPIDNAPESATQTPSYTAFMNYSESKTVKEAA